MVIHQLGIPLGEVAGVRRWIVPHGPLGWRRADHREFTKEIADALERFAHSSTISLWLTFMGLHSRRSAEAMPSLTA
jgi:hypothetical protein